jgi:serine-aspartate repeat-containing protein C/D/E
MKPVRVAIFASGAFLCAAFALTQAARPSAGPPTADPKTRDVTFRPASPASGPSPEAAAAAPAPIFGSISTAPAGVSALPTGIFAFRADVFLAAGPMSTPCQFAAYLTDGKYYFQVTDSTGRTLLSTDPVSERAFTVKGGVIASYDGTTHFVDGKTACGSLLIELLPFNDAGSKHALYVVWVTPVSDFEGNPTQVDPVCGSGCFHGFHTDLSLTSSFRVEDKASCDPSFCVSGVAFNDSNGNGIRDPGEPGLDGVPIHVESAGGLVLTGLSGPDGSFQICGLTSGDAFRVTSPAPLGFNKTGPVNATVAPRVFAKDFAYVIEVCLANQPNLLFPNQPIPGAIGGAKFEDLNANGVRDPGEPPLSGVTITLTPSAGGTGQTATTDASGNFLFTNVSAGNFVLSETVPSGFTQTAPLAGTIPITLAANGSSLGNLFGNFHGILTGTISGTKFNDVNGNGVRDAGEPGTGGVTIELSSFPSCVPPPSLPVLPVGATTTTGPDGSFTLTDVPLGCYLVYEILPAGFQQTFPPGPGFQFVNLTLTQRTVTGLLFGNQALTATISGTKFNDANGNGVRDAGEAGVANITIQLKTTSGTLVASTTTDVSGSFTFGNVTPGQYVVSEVVPSGFVQTVPAAPGTISVTAVAGQTASGLLFGNQAVPMTGSISGTKYFDLDFNGMLNVPPDRPLPGITFTLTDSQGHTLTTTSAADGTFKFSNLAPGTYVLSETLPPNFFQTFPGTQAAPGTYTITLAPGQQAAGFLFLNKC